MVDLLKDDIVKAAESNINNLVNGNKLLKANQIRKFMSAIVALKNKADLELVAEDAATKACVKEKHLSPALTDEVRFLKVDFLYQAGRRQAGGVKDFVLETSMDKLISNIGNSREKFEKFVKYFEALVAFHKYYGKEG